MSIRNISDIEAELKILNQTDIDLSKTDSYIDVLFEYDKYITNSDGLNNIENIPQLVKELRHKLSVFTGKELEKYLKKNNYNKIAELLSFAIQADINNIRFADYLVKGFEQKGLYKECIELYRTMFLYYSEPEYFEKIGDLNDKSGDIAAAIDAYLNSAEISDNNIRVYEKLVNMFEKTGDEESKNICLKQIAEMKGNNV